jgi:uncharacterized protein (DUF1697 family)
MTAYVALLRAVNVGGTGTLAMADLRALCEAAGFVRPQTYVNSGNVVFSTDEDERTVKNALAAALHDHAGKSIGLLVRTATEMEAVSSANPFPDAPGNRVVAIFLDEGTTDAIFEGVTGQSSEEEVRLGRREIYIRYGEGMGRSRLRIEAAAAGTARNMNTVTKLARMASARVDAR